MGFDALAASGGEGDFVPVGEEAGDYGGTDSRACSEDQDDVVCDRSGHGVFVLLGDGNGFGKFQRISRVCCQSVGSKCSVVLCSLESRCGLYRFISTYSRPYFVVISSPAGDYGWFPRLHINSEDT